jgi:hypothetical protein
VLHALCLNAFYPYASDTCLEITAKHSGFSAQAPGLAETASAKAIDARHAQWAKQLPEAPAALWDTLTAFDSDSQSALFAHCAALTVNVVKEPSNRRPDAFAHGDQLARTVNLDLAAAGWAPTVDNYLGRVPKARILEAVREANHRNLTSAMIDSRDFLAAKRRATNEVLLPAGPKIALTGGLDFNDHRLVWDKLDRVHAKHPDMVLLHGGSPKGAELIAAKWADHRKVPQIAFRPDWTKHAKAAPFKRNDAMLNVLPIGVLVFPGNGIQDNFADKARKVGIPVWKFGSGGA